MRPSKLHIVLLCLLVIFVLLYSCKNDNNIITPPTDHTPMWPMSGYNCRQSGNPFGVTTKINPIGGLSTYWVDSVPFFNSAGKSCCDAKGNIYARTGLHDTLKVLKLRYDGLILWQRDTLAADYNNGFALSNDETKIYYKDTYQLTCRDSSGNKLWSLNGWSAPSTPVIGKDGTIYVSINDMFCAVNPNGTVKWQTLQLSNPSSQPSLDRDGNIYIVQNDQLIKFNTNGIILWRINYPIYNSSVLIDGFNNLYITSIDTLFSLDKNGTFRWSKPCSGYFIPAITSDNYIIYYSSSFLFKVDNSGKELYRFPFDTNSSSVVPLFLDDFDNLYIIYGLNYTDYVSSYNKDFSLRWSGSINYSQCFGFLITPGSMIFGESETFFDQSQSYPSLLFALH